MSEGRAEEVYVRVSDVLPWLRHADDCGLPMMDLCTCGIGDIPTVTPAEKLEAARSALAWVSGEGQRNCRGGTVTCAEWVPDAPEVWCDVCVTGAALYTLSVP